MSCASELVVELGDRVAAWGKYVARHDGDWLDLARVDDLMFKPADWKSDRSVRLPDEQNLSFELGDLRTSGAAVTVITFRPSSDQAVLVVAAGDVDAVEAALRPQLGEQLCVVPSRWTRSQLDDARDYARQRWDDWQVETISERCDENAQAHIGINLLRVRPEIAAWADALPAGLVSLDPILLPA